MYEERTYRKTMRASDLTHFQIVEFESDLDIAVEHYSKEIQLSVQNKVHEVRMILNDYERKNQGFFKALSPLPICQQDPLMIRKMKMASKKAGVGPMASVAGAVSDSVGRLLMQTCKEVIVENGGDLFFKSTKSRRVAIDSGKSGFGTLTLAVKPCKQALGICTSSGKMGHSMSFGQADAATIISHDVLLADAMATAVGNRIKTKDDIGKTIDWAKHIDGVSGILIIADGSLGAWGEIQLV